LTVYLTTQTPRYVGLSTDAKPVDVPVGSYFWERDTGQTYICHDGTNWSVYNPVNANIQFVTADANNSFSGIIAAGSTASGAATSTLGVAAIQVSLKADQNCHVTVEQSPDNAPTIGAPHWDIVDEFEYITSLGGASWTVQAVNSYVRVTCTNIGPIATTYTRLQTALCPIVEALPRSLTDMGRLKVEASLVDEYGNEIEASPFNELRVAQSIKLNGSLFTGTILDTNFWSTVSTNGGSAILQASTATTGGELVMATGTTASGAIWVNSLRRARFSVGHANYSRHVVQLPDTGIAGNKRRWGIGDFTTAPTLTDGAYFQLNGTTFGVCVLRGGTETPYASGTFNGVLGSTYTLDTAAHAYEIYYSPMQVRWTIDGTVLHTHEATAQGWANTQSLYLGMDNTNTAITTNNKMLVRAATIHRLGPLTNAPLFRHFATGTSSVLKYSAGKLHTVTINTAAKATMYIYNAVASTAGTEVAIITTTSTDPAVTLNYELDFYTGLYVVTTATTAISTTVAYE
jgi:hypothetical protein